jgi:hypothetical protein
MTKYSVRARQLQQPAAANVEVRIPINRWHEYINPSTVEVQQASGNSVVPPRVAAGIMLVAGMSQCLYFVPQIWQRKVVVRASYITWQSRENWVTRAHRLKTLADWKR